MKPIIALVDCNSFFVSCERVFQPHLEGKPVIVLSSNDGCAIARSSEAKALGIQMGAPLFKIQDIIKKGHVKVISSNFSLYGDMSSRVMETLRQFSPSLEIYSIDEAFLNLSLVPEKDLFSYACLIRKIVKLWTGIPVSIGIGPTKTLAKVANHLAKKHSSGCCVLLRPDEINTALRQLSLQDIWGIGPQWSKKLSHLGLKTASDLAQTDPHKIRKIFNVVLSRTALELKGIPCLSLEEISPPKKNLISSRSFGIPVTSFEILRQAVSFHASSLAQKLRQQQSLTCALNVFIHTNRFQKGETYYSNACVIPLPFPSQDTAALIKAAISGLEKIFKNGSFYKKTGVTALQIYSAEKVPHSLFQNKEEIEKRKSLLKAFDKLNAQFGRGSVIFASEGFHKTWRPKACLKSPSFTQEWNQLPRVK
ncbi:MAG: Y-family DNA polymerase [Alphaproteobacteria bacterium]|nr:Y-family DNA polymerase [Alphaproteobacteria bacterium]